MFLNRFLLILSLALPPSVFAESDRLSVAVLPFIGQGVDSVSALVVTDALSDELLRTGKVQAMERSQIRAILEEQGFEGSGSCEASECAVKTGRLLSVHDVVVGTIGKLGESYSLSVRLVNVETGEVSRSSRRMQQGAIDAVVASALPAIAAELMGTEPLPANSVLAPISKPEVVRARPSPRSDSAWEARHRGFHPRAQLVAGISSVTEAPLSVRLGAEYEGYGAMVGAGPTLPMLDWLDVFHLKTVQFVPDLELFRAWNRYQVDLGYSRVGYRDDEDTYTVGCLSADFEMHFGLPGRPNVPGGFGLLVGAGYVMSTHTYPEVSSYWNGSRLVEASRNTVSESADFPIFHFAVLLSNW